MRHASPFFREACNEVGGPHCLPRCDSAQTQCSTIAQYRVSKLREAYLVSSIPTIRLSDFSHAIKTCIHVYVKAYTHTALCRSVSARPRVKYIPGDEAERRVTDERTDRRSRNRRGGGGRVKVRKSERNEGAADGTAPTLYYVFQRKGREFTDDGG